MTSSPVTKPHPRITHLLLWVVNGHCAAPFLADPRNVLLKHLVSPRSAPVANLQHNTAATNARRGGSCCAYSLVNRNRPRHRAGARCGDIGARHAGSSRRDSSGAAGCLPDTVPAGGELGSALTGEHQA